MTASNAVPMIDQIEAIFNELRPEMGLGPVSRDPDQRAVAAPLVAAFDPMHPTLCGIVCASRVCICVEWVVAMHTIDGIGRLANQAMRWPREGIQTAGIVLALAGVLATNRTNSTSCAGLDLDSGKIFVRDSISAAEAELVGLRERLISLIEHARGIRQIVLGLDLDLPDPPESPLPNGY